MELDNLNNALNRIQQIKSRFETGAPGTAASDAEDFSQLLSDQISSTTPSPAASSVTSLPYGDSINSIASKYGVDPSLVAAVIKAESNFDPNSVSSAGAVGLMQIMPSNFESLGITNARDPLQNIEGGVRMLRQLLDRFGGDTRLALAAYNAGPNAVTRYGGIPPYSETQAYVPRVLGYYDGFKGQASVTSATSLPAVSGTTSSVVNEATKYLGVKYVWGGSSPTGGFDCSGLTQYVYKKYGVEIPHSAAAQSKMGTAVTKGQLAPGDLVFFAKNGRVHHVGIFIGNGKFLHAPHTGDVVKVSSLEQGHYAAEFVGGRRFLN